MVFSQGLPILSDAFTPQTTGYVSRSTLVFPNNLETYYLINATEDTLLGWSQDTAFCYQSLRHITNKTVVKGHFVPRPNAEKSLSDRTKHMEVFWK